MADSATSPLLAGGAGAAAATGGHESHAMTSGGRGWKHYRPRDLPCLALYTIVFLAFLVVGSVGISYGDPARMEAQLLNATSDPALAKALADRGEGAATVAAMQGIAALRRDAGVIFGMAGGAVVAALAWTAALRAFVRPFLWATAILGILGVAFLGACAVGVSLNPEAVDVSPGKLDWLKWVGAALLVISLGLTVALLIFRKHIKLTVVLFEEASRGLAATPTLFLACLAVVAGFLSVAVFWLYSFVGLYTVPAGETTVKLEDLGMEAPQAGAATTVTFQQFSTPMRNLMWFHVFALLWIAAYLSAVFQMTVGGAMTHWYFCGRPARATGSPHPDADRLGGHPFVALLRALTVSSGTAAFGSLILAAVQFLNLIVRTAEKKASATGNRVAKCCLGCVSGCLGCIAKLVSFVNGYAYVYCAMHGKSFMGGAKACFDLLGAHGLSAVVIHTLGDFVLFLGKLFGVGIFTGATILVLQKSDHGVTPITVVAVAFITFFIFNFFARVISVAVDSVFVAYAEDLERVGGDHKNGAALYCDSAVHHTIQDAAQAKQATRPSN